MQGNFQFDRGSYPFTATRIGNAYKVLYTPSLCNALDVQMPGPLAHAVALRVNTQYHASKAGGRVFDGTPRAIAVITREEVDAAYEKDEIDGPTVMGIHNKLADLGL